MTRKWFGPGCEVPVNKLPIWKVDKPRQDLFRYPDLMKGTLTMMMTVVEVKMTTTTRTFGDGEEDDLIDNDDIYIMMQCLSVCNEKWALS